MEAAREAIHAFTSKRGHHTDVDEVVNPAVTHETIIPTRHEEFTEAIDREVHQHHYHTTVQPIEHHETLPEKHSHNMLPIEKREHHHGDHDAVKRGVSAELAQFANLSVTHEVEHTRSTAAAITGEHVHHHVHETVQPIIHKETIQPEVVHTTIPIHEVHHAEATHHGMSALPMKTLAEFMKAGGLVHGSERHTHEEYEGAPRPYNKELLTSVENVLRPRSSRSSRSSISSVPNSPIHSTTHTTTHTTGPTTTMTKKHMKRDSGVGHTDSLNGMHTTNGMHNTTGTHHTMGNANPLTSHTAVPNRV